MRLEIELSDEEMDALADRVAERLVSKTDASPWLDVAGAADYLRAPKSRVYSLVSAKRIPFHKDGSRLLFDRAELDPWVRNGGGIRP